MKKILILGAGSYIGTSFQTYTKENYSGQFCCERTSLRRDDWRRDDWSVYDCVINVTGKAHADIGSLSEDERQEYYKINCDLACETAKKAITDRVKQYIYFSSIIVYGDSSNSRKPVVIKKDTKPKPSNFYGDSKLRAEKSLEKIFDRQDGDSRLAILRPPMIYGAGCRGNFSALEKMAEKLPFFPDYRNKRSMLYIENLCEFLCALIRDEREGIFFPQNREYASTARLVALLGQKKGRHIRLLRMLAPFAAAGRYFPGRIGGMAGKAFGSLVYEKNMSNDWDGRYQKYSLEESIERMADKAR